MSNEIADLKLWTGDHYNEGIGRDDIFDKLREECGVFGVYGHHDAAAVSFSVYMPFSIAVRKVREFAQ